MSACACHIRDVKHHETIHPVKVAGFACPQCFSIFSSRTICMQHIIQKKHFTLAHKFEGDRKKSIAPLAMPESVLQQFLSYCKDIPWYARCKDCSGLSLGPFTADFREPYTPPDRNDTVLDHVLRGHKIEAVSAINQQDVVCYLSKQYSCDTCRRLFDMKPSAKEHRCKGLVTTSKVDRMQDLLFRCALEPLTTEFETGNAENRPVSAEPGLAGALSDPGVDSPAAVAVKPEMDSKKRSRATDENEEIDVDSPARKMLRVDDSSKPAAAAFRDEQRLRQLQQQNAVDADESMDASDNGSCEIVEIETESRNSPAADGSAAVDNKDTVAKPDNRKMNVTDIDDDDLDLTGYRNVVFLDIDNWSKFFYHLPAELPDDTFIWGFYAATTNWKEPLDCEVYQDAKRRGIVHVSLCKGRAKDAADFCLCMHVGRQDLLLSKEVTFTILSGDKGFNVLQEPFSRLHRRVDVLNPHSLSDDSLFALIRSIVET